MPSTGDAHIDEWLVDYLDGMLDEVRAAKLERHVQQCGECRLALSEYEKIREDYRALDEEPSEALAKAVRREVSRGEPLRRSRWWLFSAAAASLLLAIFFMRPREAAAPVVDCHQWRVAGERLAGEGKYEDAIEQFSEATRCDPSSPEVAGDYHRQGALLAELGRNDDAVVRLQRVLDDFPDYEQRPEVLLAVVTVQQARGDREKALASYAQYLEEFPERSPDAPGVLDEAAMEQLRALGYIQ